MAVAIPSLPEQNRDPVVALHVPREGIHVVF